MSPKVLIVDDSPIMRLRIKDILTSNGFSVVGEASNGEEAIDKYDELKPNVVTMDITMPGKDGIEALAEIMAKDKMARIVMVTAIDQRDSIMKAIRLGATDYIIKPFEEERVVGAVKAAAEHT